MFLSGWLLIEMGGVAGDGGLGKKRSQPFSKKTNYGGYRQVAQVF